MVQVVYDSQLITVFVIDEHGAGLPVAWAISNREVLCCSINY